MVPLFNPQFKMAAVQTSFLLLSLALPPDLASSCEISLARIIGKSFRVPGRLANEWRRRLLYLHERREPQGISCLLELFKCEGRNRWAAASGRKVRAFDASFEGLSLPNFPHRTPLPISWLSLPNRSPSLHSGNSA